VFAGATRLQGTARLADGGAIALQRLDLASATARLTLSGTLSAERVLDARITAGAVPAASDEPSRRTTRAGAAAIERLAFDGSVRGPLAAPRVEGRLDAAGVRMPQGSLASLGVSLLAEPEAPAAQHGAAADDARPSKRFRLHADARADGIALKEPAPQAAIGERAALTLRGVVSSDGAADLEVLRIESPTLDARYMGRAGPSLLAARSRPRWATFPGSRF
jgi:translocation and assembly module TamB